MGAWILAINLFQLDLVNHEIPYDSVGQLQARGPRVAHHSVFSGPRKHSGKVFKSEICWKACEVPFVSLNCLCWMKCICTRTMNNTFSVGNFVLFIYFTIKLEGTALPAPDLDGGGLGPRCGGRPHVRIQNL